MCSVQMEIASEIENSFDLLDLALFSFQPRKSLTNRFQYIMGDYMS